MIVIVLSIGGVVYSLYSIGITVYSYHKSAKTYESVENIYENAKQPSSKSKQMLDINHDYIGWIKIQNTNINYPVVRTSNNHFYLSHNFYKEKDSAGSIFMDYTNSVEKLDKNIILYGHNMKDNSMFGSLKKYLQKEFYQEHKEISFDYLGSTYKWEIFSIYTARETEWMKTNFTDSEEFHEFINRVKIDSQIPTQLDVGKEDTILTLSTCTNSDEAERIIVHAKLIDRGEL